MKTSTQKVRALAFASALALSIAGGGNAGAVPSTQCPCNVGLPGVSSQLSTAAQKPAAAPISENSPIENPLTLASPVVAPITGKGFDWGDALIGAAATAGIFLLGAAGALRLRRRRDLAHL